MPSTSRTESANQSLPRYSTPSYAMRRETLCTPPSTRRVPRWCRVARGSSICFIEEGFQCREQLLRLFYIGDVAGPLQLHKSCAQRGRCCPGGLERNGAFGTVHHDRRTAHGGERVAQVVITEAFPDGLLDFSDHPEGCEVSGSRGVGEVACDAQFEGALPV